MVQTGSVSSGFSWSPSYEHLHRLMMASTRLCKTSHKAVVLRGSYCSQVFGTYRIASPNPLESEHPEMSTAN